MAELFVDSPNECSLTNLSVSYLDLLDVLITIELFQYYELIHISDGAPFSFCKLTSAPCSSKTFEQWLNKFVDSPKDGEQSHQIFQFSYIWICLTFHNIGTISVLLNLQPI